LMNFPFFKTSQNVGSESCFRIVGHMNPIKTCGTPR
jgi:hypothetical protein